MEFEDSQPYRLGKIYHDLGELLMNPATDMRDIAEFGVKMGFRIGIEIIPDESSRLNEG